MQKKGISWINVLTCIALASLVTYIYLGGPDFRGILLFIVFLVFSETMLILRWRLSLPCKVCGFDPALYLRDPKSASERVRKVLEAARTPDDLRIGKQNPFGMLPVVKVKRDERPRGRTVNRTV